jgi:DNA-binding NarL/FixJ family response regulator
VIVPTTDSVFDNVPVSALNDSQRQIAILIAKGLTNQDIATYLGLERRVVSDHVAQILWRLGAADRGQVTVWAARHRLYRSTE